MTRCDRFEREALLLLEQGEPLDDHFATCPDCLEARAAYDRLRQEVAAGGRDLEPPADWQARTWERIEARRRRRWWQWPRLAVPAGLAAAAAAAVFLLLLVRTPKPGAVSLTTEVAGGAEVRRGEEAQPGDRLLLEASTGGAAYAELRVYFHDRELVMRCSDEPPCRRRGGHLFAELTLDAAGAYQPLLLVSEHPLPEPAADLDADSGAALDAGARIELGREIDVR